MDNSQGDRVFLNGFGFDKNSYRAHVEEEKKNMLASIRRRLVRETHTANVAADKQAKTIRLFVEVFMQGQPQEKRYFIKMIVGESPIQVMMINNTDFENFLSPDYRENMYILDITKKKEMFKHLDTFNLFTIVLWKPL